MSILLKRLAASHPTFFASPGVTIATTGESVQVPVNFTHCSMSSVTGDIFMTYGGGKFDPATHTHIALKGTTGNTHVRSASTVINDLLAASYNPSLMADIMTKWLGNTGRSTLISRVPILIPAMLREIVSESVSAERQYLVPLFTDFLSHIFGPFGLITRDSSYVVRKSVTDVFPTFEGLVQSLDDMRLRRVMDALATVSLPAIKAEVDRKGVISPVMVGHHLATAIYNAVERSRGAIDSKKVVESVFTAITLAYLPESAGSHPKTVSSRVRADQSFISLNDDASLFSAVSKWAATAGSSLTMIHSDEEFVHVVLPTFMEMMATSTDFVKRAISDVVAYYGKTSVYDDRNRPSNVVFYDAWSFSTDAYAFVGVRQVGKADPGRFLVEQSDISHEMMDALGAVSPLLSPTHIAESRTSVHELIPVTQRMGADGSNVQFQLLSPRLFVANKADQVTAELMQLLAVSKVRDVRVSVRQSKAGNILYLSYAVHTPISRPVGSSPIKDGVMRTSTPLEALVYCEDFKPTSNFAYSVEAIRAHERDFHTWDLKAKSHPISTKVNFEVNLRNKIYGVDLDEKDLFGSVFAIDRVRVLENPVLKATVSEWVQAMQDDVSTIEALSTEAEAQQVVDTAFVGSLKTVRMASVSRFVDTLITISNSRMGERIKDIIDRRVAAQLIGSDLASDYADMTIGYQKAQIDVRVGLLVLQNINFITPDVAQELSQGIQESGVLGLRLA